MLTRYRRPQAPAVSLSRDPFFQFVDRFFNDFQTGYGHDGNADLQNTWTPAMDVVENEDAFVATADLPGLSKEDIQISLDEGVLTVSGERKFEHTDEGKEGHGFRRFERAYGSFSRSFTLPRGIEQDKVAATFENGVLTLTLPKSEVAKSRTISIS